MANNAIGILFEVRGGGDINKESGRRINGQLRNLIGQINKSDTVKLKIQIDSNYFNEQIKQLRSQLQALSNGVSASKNNSRGTNSAQKQSREYTEARRTITEYYKAQTQLQRAIGRTNEIIVDEDGNITSVSKRWEALKNYVDQTTLSYKKLLDESGNISDDTLATFDASKRMTFDMNAENITANAEQAWSNLTAKVHDYISRVEDSASRNKVAAQSLKELRDMANSTDYRGYDDLKKKLAEVQQYINENALATDTWYQKMMKTFGSRVRSALAGIIVAKTGQYIKEVYDNVVNLDGALVNLQIASGKTREDTKELVKEYADLAQKLGATTSEVANAADTWLRQGYSTEEANTLITNSMMLSKLGQMESAEASKALTSAMKGYGVAVNDSAQIVDKLTKVDMEAAASAGDIATAMAETATSAKLSGVSMDALIGYITTVKEVTQDGSESVGVFFKTLFARMNNVAAGKFIDDETGESLNDVEAVLGNLGIALRGVNGEFRNSSDVLDDVAARWDTFNDTERNAIATAMAGTRNFEKFNVLMSNYGTAMGYATAATEAGGTAVAKFGAYTEGVEGKMNALKAAFEKFSVAFLDSDLVVGVVEFFTVIMNGVAGVASFIDSLGGLPTVLLAVASALLLVNGGLIAYNAQVKITAAYTAILGFFTKLKTGLMSVVHAIPNAIVAWKAYAAGTVSASTAMQASIPVIGLVLAAVTALVGALSIYNGQIDEARQETLAAADAAAGASDEIYKLTQEYISLSDAVIDDIAVKEKLITCEDALIKKLDMEKAELQELIDKYGNYEDAVKAAAVAKLQDEERDLRSAYHITAEDLVENQGEKSVGLADLYGTMAVKVEEDEEAATEQAINAINQLISSGKVSSYSANFEEGNFWRGDGLFDILWAGDGVSPDSTEDILAAYEDIKTMMDYVQSTVGDKNKVYNELLTIYNNAKSDVEKYSSAVDALNTNLAEQYVVGGLIGREIPANKADFDSYRQSVIDSAIASGEFAGKTEDIERAIDSILKQNTDFTQFYATTADGSKGVTVALKSAFDILEEVQDGYDGLADALTNVTSDGYLTADALASLVKLEKDGDLAGLKLADILTQDANGYKLAEDALQKYIQALISAYTVEGEFASQKDKENAIANLENLRSVLATLTATQEESTDANKAYREELEKEQEMYKDQLDKFEELIDLRKDLLQTYKEELDYQKELEKRQRKVASLQTKLSVARLDSSAAGQARVRELEEELQEAQEDLDDFTLEHAIDVLTEQLDNTNAEWKSIIDKKLNKITELLGELDMSPEVNIVTDTSWVRGALNAIEGLIGKIHGVDVDDNGASAGGNVIDGDTYDKWSEYWYANSPGIAGPPSLPPEGWTEPESPITVEDYRYFIQMLVKDVIADNKENGRSELYTGSVDGLEWSSKLTEAMKTDDLGRLALLYDWFRVQYTAITGDQPTYHEGGFVGGSRYADPNEEFAKLLKGEFVSTPTQMKRFMEDTLPKIANYSTAGGSNEFNAPLVEIRCENVTAESLPELERVVNEAVKEIKKQLDGGMSRTGFKRPTARRLM